MFVEPEKTFKSLSSIQESCSPENGRDLPRATQFHEGKIVSSTGVFCIFIIVPLHCFTKSSVQVVLIGREEQIVMILGNTSFRMN